MRSEEAGSRVLRSPACLEVRPEFRVVRSPPALEVRSGSVAVVLAGPVLVTFAVLVAPVCVLRGDNVVFSADGRVNMVVAPLVAVPEVVAVVFDIVVVPHVNLGGFPSWQLHTSSQVSHSDGHLGLVVVVAVVVVVVIAVVAAVVVLVVGAGVVVVVSVVAVMLGVSEGADSLGVFMIETAVVAIVLAVVILDGRLIVHKFSSEHKLRALSDCISAPFPTKSIIAAGSPITVTTTANWGVCASERRGRDLAEEVFGFAVVAMS